MDPGKGSDEGEGDGGRGGKLLGPRLAAVSASSSLPARPSCFPSSSGSWRSPSAAPRLHLRSRSPPAAESPPAVEYKEYLSGHLRHAIAEAPKEALPLDCHPTYGTAWFTKTKFKVNRTYSCRYSLGTGKADMYTDHLFNCQAKDPSSIEMIRRFFILFMKSNFSFGNKSCGYLAEGLVSGTLVGMCSIILVKGLWFLWLALVRDWEARKLQIEVFVLYFRRTCLIVAYICTMGWLAGYPIWPDDWPATTFLQLKYY